MLMFILGFFLGLWSMGGIMVWRSKDRLPFLTEMGVSIHFFACGPLVWLYFVWSEFLVPYGANLVSKVKGRLVDEKTEKELLR